MKGPHITTVATWTTAVGGEVREICLMGDETKGVTTVISTREGTTGGLIRGMITTMVDEMAGDSMVEVTTEMGATTMDTIGHRGVGGIR